jgi:uncharacterized protein (DUF2267 family)
MSYTGLDVFDSTIQKTNLWLKELMDIYGTPDKHKAYLVLRAVLITLRDRLTPPEAADLAAQLPMLIRGMYYDGWRPGSMPLKERHKEEFLVMVASHFRNDPDVDPDRMVKAVFELLTNHVADGEINDIIRMLPAEVRDLWPEVKTVAGGVEK